KSSKAILVGYEPNGFRLWDLKSRKFIVARDVIVDEKNMSSNIEIKDSVIDSNVLNESKDDENSDQINVLNESKDGKGLDQMNILNESKNNEICKIPEKQLNVPNESKDCCDKITDQNDKINNIESNEFNDEHFRNESTEGYSETLKINEQINKMSTSLEKVSDMNKNLEVRKSERLKGKPMPSYRLLS
ncbi:hypothetical protein KR093_009750, partial [Drosophila rubida]